MKLKWEGLNLFREGINKCDRRVRRRGEKVPEMNSQKSFTALLLILEKKVVNNVCFTT